MRLDYIKLAGFKSFVDATKVPFPDQMTCVVGPNGCGKSNVIDAVRWVLGESSAKNLRGDAMTDVIFNGSSTRKPVSRASVELVFDNSDNRLEGEFASYSDISVKRVVTRDGQSTYFLNGNKCRRRDITDLFLGTGLGPRSYAIIEQGMISRLIESKPQELRVFIEEAAGISKYKERRKETESRMRKTHENLERLNDVREELGVQLAKLQRQAAAALRYKSLKAEERTYKAQLQALRWTQYQQQCDRIAAQLRAQETELERWIAEQRGSERGQVQLREQQQDLKAQLDQAQQQFYQCTNEITRIEQSIQHRRQLAEQRRKELDELQLQSRQLNAERKDEQVELAELEHAQQELEPECALQQAHTEALAETVESLQEHKLAAVERYQQQAQSSQQARQQVAVLATQIDAVDEALKGIEQQRANYRNALAQLDVARIKVEYQQQFERVQTYQVEQEAAAQHVLACEQAYQAAYQHVQECLTDVQHRSGLLQQCEQQINSYMQLLASTEQQQDNALNAWLEAYTWQPLRELLQVQPEWQQAVEVIAGPWLNAPVVPAASASAVFAAPGKFGLVLNQPTEARAAGQTAPVATLSDVITGSVAQLTLFSQVARVESAQHATQIFSSTALALAVDQQGRVYTRDGWRQTADNQSQVLAWQQVLDQAQAQQPELNSQLTAAKQRLEAAQTTYTQRKAAVGEAQQAALEAAKQLAQGNAELATLRRQQEDAEQRMTELQRSLEQLQERETEQQQKRAIWQAQRAEVSDQLDARHPQQTTLEQQVQQLETELLTAQAQYQQAIQQNHQLGLQAQQVEQSIVHIQRSLSRSEQRMQQLTARLEQLSEVDNHAEIELEQAELEEALLRREQAEQVKYELGQALSEVEQQLNGLNQGQHEVLRRIDEQRSQVESTKMELIVAQERGHSLLDGLQDSGYSLKQVLEEMPETANEPAWQQQLDKLARALHQLGAINLAAIEEAEVQGQRKAYLDAQHDDLTQSLALLEEAIKKIDRETRQRFRKTFDQVNHDLGQLFPKVFGGGSAYLALTDDDLLETGVTIMARPPGKKNSTIHLLSGGEKALTALSLVFAIFRLNPAPFCMLDEVDAPLDDANVGRFCRLVQEMSESVQFIYISHNKIAMEMATHLAGVTMQEPGVSRLVTVNVDEAVAMAEAS